MRIRNLLSKEFMQTLLSLLLYVLFACVLSLLIYSTFVSVLTQLEIERADSSLSNACQLVDLQINGVKNMILSTMNNTNTQIFMNIKQPLKNYDYDSIRKTFEFFKKQGEYNDFIEDIYIYNVKCDLLLSTKYATSTADVFYPLFLGYGGLTYDGWKKNMTETYYQGYLSPAADISVNHVRGEYITYLQTYSIDTLQNSKGVILALIPTDNILTYLKSTVNDAPSWLTIADKSGNLIFTYNINKESVPSNIKNHSIITSNQTSMLVIESVATQSGLKYTVAIPTEDYLGKLKDTKKVFALYILVFSLISVFCAFLLAYYNNLPVKKLVNSIKAAQPNNNKAFFSEFNIIKASFDLLRNENTTMFGRIRSYTPMVEYLGLRQLMLGEMKWESLSEEIKTLLTDISAWEQIQVIGIVVNNNQMDLNVANGIILQELLDFYLKNRYRLVSFANGTFFLLASWPGNNRNGIQQNLEAIQTKALKNYNLSLTAGCSGIYAGIGEISRCYVEAAQVLKYRTLMNESIIWYDETNNKTNTGSISINEERSLINLVRAGDMEELDLAIPVLCQRYLMNETISQEHLEKLNMQWLVIVHRIADGLPRSDLAQQAVKALELAVSIENDVNAITASIRDTLVKLCEQFKFNKKSQNELLKKKIHEYLLANFTNCNFSTQMIADAMGISVSYLYHFFKEQFGENYTDFLERTRLEYCIELMPQRGLSLKEIAHMSGYDNMNTFYKAFKRVYGMSPKMFRDSKSPIGSTPDIDTY